MTPTQVLRIVKAAVKADNIYVTANRIGVQHSTLTRYLFGQKIQERVKEKIEAFAEKPPKAGKKKVSKKPKAKKAVAKKSKPKAKAPAKKAKAVKRSKPKKASKPRAKKPSKKKVPAAPASGPAVEEAAEAKETAAE
jgi:hypothetical protein